MTTEQREAIRSILRTEPDQPIVIDILERQALQSLLDEEGTHGQINFSQRVLDPSWYWIFPMTIKAV